ncbi:hypothetical protein GGI42DRAFT_337477 [Trichoderma sp. SZMC 28013]
MGTRLSAFLGPWGLDQFYIHNIMFGYCKLFSLGGLGLWWLVDVILWTQGGVYIPEVCLPTDTGAF